MDITAILATGRIHKTLEFDAAQAPYINYNSIAETARMIGGAFIVTYAQDGAVTVILYWVI